MERIQKYLNRVYRASILDRSEAFADENLSGHQISYILQVCRHPGLTHDELAKRLLVNKSSVSRTVSKMVQNGYIYRETDFQDRRSKLLYPTEKAKNIYPRVIEYLDGWNESLTGDLSSDEQESLLYLLRHITRAASERVAEKDLSGMLGAGFSEEGN
ncbi:MAG: MarR family transcriptional regulator [Eubacteriales bacterium]|nr:MarR family transcriptional regulator [Eubacteriales bacterium]MDD4541486.1 MarR family transcriptional regulator [Eubacteriales bacterium]